MKKRMFVVLGMAAFLLSACTGKEETVQNEEISVSEMTEVQEIFVTETEIVENTENLTDEAQNSEDNKTVYSQNEIGTDSKEETAKETEVPTNETEEGLYWDSKWQHETYVEFGPDGDVYFDKYGNTYSCPVDADGNLIIE